MKKRFFALLLAVCMLMTVMAACGGNEGNNSSSAGNSSEGSTASTSDNSTGGDSSDTPDYLNLDGTLPIIKDASAFEAANGGKITMSIINDVSRTVDIPELEMVKRWKEETGIEFEWQIIPGGTDAAEKMSLMLTSGDQLPDAFWNFPNSQSGTYVPRYINEGIFMPTEDLIQKYVPSLAKILADNPKYDMETTAPDGHKYGFPYIEEMHGLVMTNGPLLINEEWLKAVNKEMPTTPDELLDVLRAFKEAGDLNGNGKDDEIPIAAVFGNPQSDPFCSYNVLYRFAGCFGQYDSTCHGNPYADHMALIDGEIVFTGMNESIRKTCDYLHTMYEEGLLNTDCFESATASTNYVSNELAQNDALIGVCGVWTPMQIINNEVRHQYTPIPQLTGEGGLSGTAINFSELQDPCNTCITVDCKSPEVIAAFVEYLVADPKLSIQSNWGAVGYNYYEDDDGVLRFNLDENGDIVPVAPFANFGEMRTNTTPARGSMIVLDEYYDKYAEYTYDAIDLLAFQKVNGKEEQLARGTTVPKMMMTPEESARLGQIQPTVSDTFDRYVAEWIKGGTSDDSWNAFLSDMEAAGVNDIVDIFQNAVARANG